MILISCRREFSDPRRFADQNVIRDYPFLPKLDQFTELGEDSLAALMQGKHVVILVHGYRNSMNDVGGAYQKLLKGMIDNGLMTDRGYQLVLGFLWPGFATFAGFFPAVPFANRAAGFFRNLLELASRSARTVDVQTHSLGARVALQGLGGGTVGFVDNLMLTSPAVDDEVLEPEQEFNGALDGCRQCFVYHTQRDNTLKFAFRVGDAPEFDRALGWKGPQHPDIIKTQCPEVYVVDCKRVVTSHGGYRSTVDYYRHWRRVVEDEALPQFDAL